MEEEHERIISRIGYYMKSKNIARIFKGKHPLLAAAGDEERINIFSNSLEHMIDCFGHKGGIWCLCSLPYNILASGSEDKTIKIWDIEDRSIISTLYGHKDRVSALCGVGEHDLVSGSKDKYLIVWTDYTAESSNYSHFELTGHKSMIMGIIALNDKDIVSGRRMEI